MNTSFLALAILLSAVPAVAQQTKPAKPAQMNPSQRNRAIFGARKMQHLSQKESEISRNLISAMSAAQRKAFSEAIRGVMGAGKVSEQVLNAKAVKSMSPADRTVWDAYRKGLKPSQASVLKKMLQNAAVIKPGPTRSNPE
jgi:hypothetical protein